MQRSWTKSIVTLFAVAIVTLVALLFAVFLPADSTPAYAAEPVEGTTTTEQVSDASGVMDADALKAAVENGGEVVLGSDITADVVIPEGKTVTINLNGHTLTNDGDHTIINYGTLTVEDSSTGEPGKVDNVTHGKAAIYNEVGATFTLASGTLDRTKEAGTSSSSSGDNSYYTLLNHGTAYINGGTIQQGGLEVGKYSSLVENGWYDGSKNTEKKPSIMTVNGGTFLGGLNSIKNDDYGELNIIYATVKNVAQAALLNWNVATIKGGSFSTDGGSAVILNGYINDTMDKGELTITGGEFTTNGGDFPLIARMDGSKPTGGVITVTVTSTNADLVAAAINVPGVTTYVKEGDAVTEMSVSDLAGLKEALNTETVKKITLACDITSDESLFFERDVTLDMNGYELTVAKTTTYEQNGKTYTYHPVVIDGANVTIVDGNIMVGKGVYANLNAILVTNGATLTLGTKSDETVVEDDRVFVTTNSGYGIVVSGGAALNMYGGSVTAKWCALGTNNTTGTAAFNVYGATLESTDDSAIFMSCYTEVALKNTTVKGKTAIDIRIGKLTVEGGSITSTRESYHEMTYTEATATGTMTGGDGSAILVKANYYYDNANKSNEVSISISSETTITGAVTIYDLDGVGNMLDGKENVTDQTVNLQTFVDELKTSHASVETHLYDVAPADGSGDGTIVDVDKVHADAGEQVTAIVSSSDELRAAFADKNYDTVVLGAGIRNASETFVIDRPVTLDLNGYTLENKNTTSGNYLLIEGGNSEAENIKVTIRNGNISSGDAAVFVMGYVDVVMENVSVKTDGRYGLELYGECDQSVTAEGCTFEGDTSGVAVFGAEKTGMTAAFSATGCTIKGGDYGVSGNGTYHLTTIDIVDSKVSSDRGTAIYHPQVGTLTISGGSEISGISGIEMRAGTLTITGGTITATGEFAADPNGNGATTSGVAVAMMQHTTERDLTLNITGGEFNGAYAVYQQNIQNNDSGTLTMSLTGGTFNGNVDSENCTEYISGGQYSVKPAAEAFKPGFDGVEYDGYYVVIETTTDDIAALLAARIDAQADVRTYAAVLGIDWKAMEALADTDDVAAAALDAYNAIGNATSEGYVAIARSAAMDALDAYAAAMAESELEAAKLKAQTTVKMYIASADIGGWTNLLLINENGDRVEKDAVAPIFAMYDMIEESTTVADIDAYMWKAISQVDTYVNALENWRKAAADEVTAAAQETAENANDAVVVPTSVYAAINGAVNYTEVNAYKTNALAEIADIRAYRADIAEQGSELDLIYGTLTEFKNAFDALDTSLTGENNAFDTLLKDVQDAITTAQNAITGGTDESSESLASIKSYLENTIYKAMTDFKEDVDKAFGDLGSDLAAYGDVLIALRDALVGDGTDGSVGKIDEILADIADAQSDITNIKTTVGSLATTEDLTTAVTDIKGALTVSEGKITSAITAAQNAITSAIASVRTDIDALETALAGYESDFEGLSGTLAQINSSLGGKIDAAQADIDAIKTAIDALGTPASAAAVTELATAIDELKAAVDEISVSVSAPSAVETVKTEATADIAEWLNAYVDEIVNSVTASNGKAYAAAVTFAPALETTDGDLYAKLLKAFDKDNADLVLKYYNDALTAIDAATTADEVNTAVATFKAQVASVEAASGNTSDLTVVYVLLIVVLVVLVVAVVVAAVLSRKRRVPVGYAPAPTPAPAPATSETTEQTEKAAPAEKAEVTDDTAATAVEPEEAPDEDAGERVVINASVKTFDEAYDEMSDTLKDMFEKVREYALSKNGATGVRIGNGVRVKRGSKQIVKLTVRRGYPVAMFVLENEMLKDYRRTAGSSAKLKVPATELVLREPSDLDAAYMMVDLAVRQLDADVEAAKERRRELLRERRRQRREAMEAAKAAQAAQAEATTEQAEPTATEQNEAATPEQAVDEDKTE